MDIPSLFLLLLTHSGFFILGTLIFIGLFHTNFLRSIHVWFYRGIAYLLVACFVVLILLVLFKSLHVLPSFTYRDIILSITLLFSVNIVIFTHLPVTAQRSVTIFMLGYLNRSKRDKMTKKQLREALHAVYLQKHNEVQRRCEEQLATGTICSVGNGYQITKKGIAFIKAYSLIADLFNVDKTNIFGRN